MELKRASGAWHEYDVYHGGLKLLESQVRETETHAYKTSRSVGRGYGLDWKEGRLEGAVQKSGELRKMLYKASICVVIASLLLGFSSLFASASQVENGRGNNLKVTKICEIKKNGDEYFGKIVRVHGIYKTDHSSYSFLLDRSCPSSKVIDVADAFHSDDESSVVAFFKSEKEACPVRGPSVCPTEIEVDAVVEIRKQSDGKLFLTIRKILSTKGSAESKVGAD